MSRHPRCGVKFANGRRCRRLAGHRGHHAIRLTIGELHLMLGIGRSR